jgi:MtN3 and saliva related transmembrane protein
MHDLIGSIAATCTTVAFFPQVLQLWRTRDARAISLPMYLIFTTGVVFWLIYGLMITSWPIIIANIVTLTMTLLVIGMKLRFKSHDPSASKSDR